jgi:hypothetical protein
MSNTDETATWRDFFTQWPTAIKRKGIVVSSFDEQIPFDDFLVSQTIIVLQRPTPDAVGGRHVALPLCDVRAMKFTDAAFKGEMLFSAGFQGGPPKKPSEATVTHSAQ